MKIFLVDDDKDTTFLMDVIFSKSKIVSEHKIFEYGQDLLDSLEDCTESTQPDVIFVDINMPEMSGFELVEAFEDKYRERCCPRTHLFMLTSSARSSDMQKAESFDSVKGFILKPLDSKKLENLEQMVN